MRCLHVFTLIIGCLLLASATNAQETNFYPVVVNPVVIKTKLETLEARTGTVIVKGSADIGSISTKIGAVDVKCREISEPATGHRELGLAISVIGGDRHSNTVVLDYDELDNFLKAIDYLAQLDWSATQLSSFDASYVTRGELRLATYSSKRGGDIEASLQYTGPVKSRAQLTLTQLAEFRELVKQAKRKLDDIQADKPQP